MDMRDQILAEAMRRFSAQGFDGTSLQVIADSVGIKKPSLLYHFKSKHELRLGVLEHMLSHWNEALPRLLLAATSGEDQFEAIVGEMIAFFTADPDRARLLVREVLDRPEEMRGLLDRHVRPWVDQICTYIRKGQEQGRLYADADPEAYTVQVINLVIASVATHQCIGALIGGGEAAPGRNAGELLRVARCSLFTQ